MVLPWHDPIRVAEDIALLDNLIGDRRLTIGLAGAPPPASTSISGSTRQPLASASTKRSKSSRRALTQERFSYEGKIFRIPATSIRPRPRRPGIAEDLFCAFAGEASFRAAAERGLGMGLARRRTTAPSTPTCSCLTRSTPSTASVRSNR